MTIKAKIEIADASPEFKELLRTETVAKWMKIENNLIIIEFNTTKGRAIEGLRLIRVTLEELSSY